MGPNDRRESLSTVPFSFLVHPQLQQVDSLVVVKPNSLEAHLLDGAGVDIVWYELRFN